MKESIRLGTMVMGFCIIVGSTTLAIAEIPIQNSDAEILGVLSVIDQNEIQAAQLAEQKILRKEILDYVRMLDKDHSKNLDMTRDLSQKLGKNIVQNTPSIDHLRTMGQQDLAALTALDTDAFAQLYIADMIKGHSEALSWIDSQGTKNEQIRDFLKETRKCIDMHLQIAQRIEEY